MRPESPSISGHNNQRLWRQWAGRLVAVVFGLLAAWLLLEVILRLAAPALPPAVQVMMRGVRITPFSPAPAKAEPLWRTSNDYGLVVRQETSNQLQIFEASNIFHLVTINWLDPNSYVAFRVPGADWQPRWPVKALVVGDSFSFCYTEYQDCWVQRLDTDHGLSVVNLGMSGTGSTSHQRILETFGLPYQPELVIWQWWGNDFYDDYSLVENPGGISGATVVLPPSTKRPKTPAAVRWLRENSAVYNVTNMWLRSTQPQGAVDYLVDRFQVNSDGVSLRFGRLYLDRAFNMSDPVNQRGFETSREALLAARDRLAETGTPVLVLLLPTKEEVYRRWTEPQLGSEWFDMIRQGRMQMLELCQAEKLDCLDPTAELVEHANRNEQIYWPDDMHFNPAGNQILAQIVAGYIRDKGLVK